MLAIDWELQLEQLGLLGQHSCLIRSCHRVSSYHLGDLRQLQALVLALLLGTEEQEGRHVGGLGSGPVLELQAGVRSQGPNVSVSWTNRCYLILCRFVEQFFLGPSASCTSQFPLLGPFASCTSFRRSSSPRHF